MTRSLPMLLLLLACTACAGLPGTVGSPGDQPPPPTEAAAPPPAAPPAPATATTTARPPRAAPAPAARDTNIVHLDTRHGRVVIRLRPDLAPRNVERIKRLSREGFYDNAPFHRVIPGFMAQTGDGERGDGTGKSRYPDLPAEFSRVPFKRGVVGMARAANPASANAQFFIVYADAPHLDGKYTVVGEVVSGMGAVDRLKKGTAANNGAVSNPDRVVRMRVAGDVR